MMQIIDPASNLTMDTILDVLPEPWHVTVYSPPKNENDTDEYSSRELLSLTMNNPSKNKIKALLYTAATHQFKDASFDIKDDTNNMLSGRIELTKYKLTITCHGKPSDLMMSIFIKGTECNDIETSIVRCKTWFNSGISTTSTTVTNGNNN